MAILGIETGKDPKVMEFMLESDKRLQSNNVVKNPYEGKIKKINSENDKESYAIVMTPIYPRFYLFGIILIILPMLFIGIRFSWWMLPGIILFSLGIFWSKIPVYLGILIGLRKQGYKGKVKIISNNEIIKRMLSCTS